MNFVVPPGGLTGFNQMTPASQRALFPRSGGARRGTRKRKKKAKSARRASAKRASGGRKMKFGSPAWQKKYKVGRFKKK